MPMPLVSVIIPAYRGGDLLGEAIQSVLDQRYAHFELIVVDDASPEDTAGVVGRFQDRRVKYLAHARNMGPDAARLTGLNASSGEIVAFLDQDDRFHPEKLDAHVAFLREHPETGLTYNPHFAVSHPSGAILGIWRPPEVLTLPDLIVGFPIPPSAFALRREWACLPELWEEATFRRGREVVFFGRLFLLGCKFALVDRVLNYRRIHAGRRFADPAGKCRDERRSMATMLGDPRCPPATRTVSDAALAGNCLVWANVAFAQGEGGVGRELLNEALALDPTLVNGRPSPLIDSFLFHAVLEAPDAEAQLRAVVAQLPGTCAAVAAELDWAVVQAHLIKGSQHLIWKRPALAEPHFARAIELGGRIDDLFLRRLSYELLSYEIEFGRRAAAAALDRLGAGLSDVRGGDGARRLRGIYHLGRAFHLYGRGDRRGVPGAVLRALAGDPRCARNRGTWSILLRTASPRWLTP